MKLNDGKTKFFVVNYSQNYQFYPRMTIPGSNKNLEIVGTTKLVGVTLSSDLKFHEHVQGLVKKAYKKIWMLRRLKDFGVKEVDLLDVYEIQIRSLLEYCVPAWNSSLTEEDINELERVQKTAMKILHGEKYIDYKTSLESCKLESLEDRRLDLCRKFALKCTQSKEHKGLFKKNTNPNFHHPTKYEVPFCRHERYRKSPIPYLTSLLNKEENN